MKTKVFIYLIYLLVHLNGANLIGQDIEEPISRDSIQEILNISSKYLVRLSHPDHDKGVHLLDLAENLVSKMDDPKLKILVNRHKLNYLISISDTVLAEEYLKKNLTLIEQVGDKRELGLYYEFLGVLKSLQNRDKERINAYKKAVELLNKYGEKEDLIDANYNLAYILKSKNQWKKSIDHAQISLDAIEVTGVKKNRKKYLYLFLAECYIQLDNLTQSETYFAKIEKDEFYKKDDPFYFGFLYQTKGKFYEKKGDFIASSLNYEKSSSNFLNYGRRRAKQISSSLSLANKLNLKEEENRRIKLENTLSTEQLQNSKYAIALAIIIIMVLIIMSVFLYKSSIYKTKTNKLLKNNNQELLEANRKVDVALNAKSIFLDSVTHELLTPLNTIKGITFLLQKEQLTRHQENQMKLINLSSDYLLNLINDVIHLNDLESEQYELKNEDFDLKELLQNLIGSLLEIKQHENDVHIEIDEDIPKNLKGDMLKISQVFINILDNALKFTKEGDIYINVLVLSIDNDNAKINFSIKDTGIGMTEEQVEKAFEDFHQGSVEVNRKYGGTGLGLSIVKRILKLYDSKVFLKSKQGIGTSLSFTIDFEISEMGKQEKVSFEQKIYEESEKIKVLLVEDNKVNQLIVEKIISDYGFSCDSANDGKEAVTMVKKNNYSIVLMDIMMPRMDGFEATRHIKIFDKNMPVIALTAISEKLNKSKFNEVGIYKVLNKPVNPELLYETIISFCSSSRL